MRAGGEDESSRLQLSAPPPRAPLGGCTLSHLSIDPTTLEPFIHAIALAPRSIGSPCLLSCAMERLGLRLKQISAVSVALSFDSWCCPSHGTSMCLDPFTTCHAAVGRLSNSFKATLSRQGNSRLQREAAGGAVGSRETCATLRKCSALQSNQAIKQASLASSCAPAKQRRSSQQGPCPPRMCGR